MTENLHHRVLHKFDVFGREVRVQNGSRMAFFLKPPVFFGAAVLGVSRAVEIHVTSMRMTPLIPKTMPDDYSYFCIPQFAPDTRHT